MRTALLPSLLALTLAGAGAGQGQAAEAFAAPGTKATLTVEYVHESVGKKQDKYDLHEWRVKRSVNLSAALAAQPPGVLPTLQPLDAAQSATLKKQAAQLEKAATQMAPMTATIEAVMAKCGDDEKCMEREAVKLGLAMSGTPQAQATIKAGKEAVQAMQPGAPRYQTWRATAQKGSYSIDESTHIVHADPICVKLPRQRCTRDEKRVGAGEVTLPPGADPRAGAGFSAVEVDNAKNTLTLMLPVPLTLLPYTETISTDEPAGTRETPTPKGPQKKLHAFRASADGQAMPDKPLTVALKGGWRSQSGEQVLAVKGDGDAGGTLTVRWRFAVQ